MQAGKKNPTAELDAADETSSAGKDGTILDPLPTDQDEIVLQLRDRVQLLEDLLVTATQTDRDDESKQEMMNEKRKSVGRPGRYPKNEWKKLSSRMWLSKKVPVDASDSD